MFNKVMVGIDEETRGRDAIALAQRLVSDDGQLTFAHVHAGYTIHAKGSNSEFEDVARDRARQFLAEVVEESGLDAVARAVGCPSVGRGLHQLAEASGSDLLVIGSTHRGLIGRVLIGDATRHALNGAPCALAIAPAAYSEQERQVPMGEIGVAYDGSDESCNALEVARALAGETDAKLSAFEAISLPTYFFPGSWKATEESARVYVDDARKRLEALGDLEGHAAYGDAAEELTVYSASVDLLVVGARDYGPIGRLMHGSTTHRLADTARSPLLILTRGARAGLGAKKPSIESVQLAEA
jgi:nucleotide-binding universal stress UspA family protein